MEPLEGDLEEEELQHLQQELRKVVSLEPRHIRSLGS